MSTEIAAVAICETIEEPARYFLVRANAPYPNTYYVWCDQLLGWLPFLPTAPFLFCYFPSRQAAIEAADKYITLPVQE
jgi:hypothetical protein